MGQAPEEQKRAAEAFVRRCYEEALEVLAITDHDFRSRDFIPLLQVAIKELSAEFGYEIVLFPGFEFTANVGKGVHILGIFPPDSALNGVDHLLTECGLPAHRHTSSGPVQSSMNLTEILNIIQRKNAKGELQGIVVCPHVQAESGLFDTEKINEWLQSHEFKNESLLCVEVPRPVSEMSKGWQRLFRSGSDCTPEWRRKRPIACIMSSDCKALTRAEDPHNYIGFRHTWIKMSRPSIESLRQAFLDHDSRVRLGLDERPENGYTYPKIESMTIGHAKFLQDNTFVFSPNLTTIIGGRGTGKSTIIEYIRLCCGAGLQLTGTRPRQNLENLKKTITTRTRIGITVEFEGEHIQIQSTAGNQPTIIAGMPPNADFAQLFPIEIYSQGEIQALADDPNGQVELINHVVQPQLQKLAREGRDVLADIKGYQQELSRKPELEKSKRELQTRIQDLTMKLERLRKLDEPLKTWKAWLSDQSLIEKTKSEARELARSLTQTIDSLSLQPIPESLADSSAAAFAREVESAVVGMKLSISKAREEFVERVKALIGGTEHKHWLDGFEAAKREYEELRETLKRDGLNPDDFLEFTRNRQEFEAELKKVDENLTAIAQTWQNCYSNEVDENNEPMGLLSKLYRIWARETDLRQTAANSLEQSVPSTITGKPLVKLNVVPFGSEKDFLEATRPYIGDRRKMSDEEWESFMSTIFQAAMKRKENPAVLLLKWMSELARSQKPSGCPIEPGERKTLLLIERLRQAVPSLETFRTPDRLEVTLFRQDGTQVGQLSEGELSVGQRCTVILTLILARNTVPLIIDQPEDDLDNEFVYTQLVPALRSAKTKRQIILATHNANIPVNGDAELVIALSTEAGRGVVRQQEGRQAIGGLDDLAVKESVEVIMEGSEEAFRRRSEMYGF